MLNRSLAQDALEKGTSGGKDNPMSFEQIYAIVTGKGYITELMCGLCILE